MMGITLDVIGGLAELEPVMGGLLSLTGLGIAAKFGHLLLKDIRASIDRLDNRNTNQHIENSRRLERMDDHNTTQHLENGRRIERLAESISELATWQRVHEESHKADRWDP